MLKSDLLRLLQQEIRRHDFSTFIDEPPSMAQGGRGVCVPGCSTCRKPLRGVTQFVEHLTNDVLPKVIENLKPLKLPLIPPELMFLKGTLHFDILRCKGLRSNA